MQGRVNIPSASLSNNYDIHFWIFTFITAQRTVLSCLADCAQLPSLYILPHRSAYLRRHVAEGQVSLSTLLGGLNK